MSTQSDLRRNSEGGVAVNYHKTQHIYFVRGYLLLFLGLALKLSHCRLGKFMFVQYLSGNLYYLTD